MTRGDIFDKVFDAVYEEVFSIIDKDPNGGIDECGEIDWEEDVSDREIIIDAKITIKPVVTNHTDKKKKISFRRKKVVD